jgi:lipopolysaccharide/colanic/teichoic acid biosynthesis glycosyltransferase
MSGSRETHFNPRLARVIDVTIASVVLVALLPLIILISVAIIAESGFPVLFWQTRLGRDGAHFLILKFRKFRRNAPDTRLPLTLNNDARLSHVGRILAETKLDELPQFLNVLLGTMAIVGPRPESLELAHCHTKASSVILAHTPGIFGPSQVAFRNEASFFPPNVNPTQFYRDHLFPTKARIDASYYASRTIFSDFRWLVLGLLSVLGMESARRVALAEIGRLQGLPNPGGWAPSLAWETSVPGE